MLNKLSQTLSPQDFELLQQGKKLPVMETFYSIQGEGFNTGKAAYFIRIGGCDVGCSWCDVKESWNPLLHPLMNTDEVILEMRSYPANAAVITGGEPLNYNLNYLCEKLKQQQIQLFLETSGTQPFSGIFDWICLSPKKNQPPLEEICSKANELKVIIETEDDLMWAEQQAMLVKKSCLLLLQPEWSKFKTIIHPIADYVMQHPQWHISLQTHKFMRIP